MRADGIVSLKFSINDKCTSCMACVRVCPVEAIAVPEGQPPHIVEDTCIECGLCVPSCHHDAIDVVGDRTGAARAVAERESLLILPAEIAVYLFPATPEQIVNACLAAGFDGVFFEILGDELVAGEYLKLWREEFASQDGASAAEGGSSRIRSTSPIVVDYCRTRLPELLPFLVPVVTPAEATARYLRAAFREDVRIVYAGIGTPGQNGSGDIDICISFTELESLLEEAGLDPELQPLTMSRIPPERRRYLSLAGGLPWVMLDQQTQASRSFKVRRGLRALPALARAALDEEAELGFVDILPFEGNLGHPAYGPDEDLYWRRQIAELAEPPRADEPVVDPEELDLSTTFQPKPALGTPDPEVVRDVLERIGTAPNGQPWNTGSCGHGTCLEFARAVARGRSTLSLCPIYLARQYQQASRDALHDGLTGVFTYRVLEERLEEEVSRVTRTGNALSVLFVDLDRFKPINDRHGHATGNEILRSIARILQDAIRSTDIVCRYGGDEFVVILVNPDLAGAYRVAEQIRRRIEGLRVPTVEGETGVTASIGLAYHSGAEPSGLTAESLMAEADASLYVAKAQGGNTVHPKVERKVTG